MVSRQYLMHGSVKGPPDPPLWVQDLLRKERPQTVRSAAGSHVTLAEAGPFALASACVQGARDMDAASLERRVAEAYGAILKAMSGLAARHPVRMWNYLPGIHQAMDGERDRYMVFNAGRFRALSQWLGGSQAFDQRVATASAVGHDGTELLVHCLAAETPAMAVENPRQIAPHRYSSRYGPLPPCFARGAVLSDLILVGGTASIVGEESLHRGRLQSQWQETLRNLAAVLEAAHAKAGVGMRGEEGWLARFRELRVYYPRAADGEALEAMVRQAFAGLRRLELQRADICRPELLVEVEGVAELLQ